LECKGEEIGAGDLDEFWVYDFLSYWMIILVEVERFTSFYFYVIF